MSRIFLYQLKRDPFQKNLLSHFQYNLLKKNSAQLCHSWQDTNDSHSSYPNVVMQKVW